MTKSILICDSSHMGVHLALVMFKDDPRILNDLAKVAGGAMNVLSGLRQQISEEVKVRVEEIATRMDLVPREDVDRLEAMIAKLQSEQRETLKRLGALEGKKPPVKKAATKKTAVKKTASKTSKKSTKKTARKKASK